MPKKSAKKITRKIIIGNWKMNPRTQKEADVLFTKVAKNLSRIRKTDVVICPPYPYLERLKSAGRRTKKIVLGAQDSAGAEVGPFTGEISPDMLYNIGVKYVILGHSERRTLGESNDDIQQKVKMAISAGLMPILCVGESVRDESHSYFNIVKTQLEECLAGVSKNFISKVIIAYEPVWALSSTKDRRDATAHDAYEMAVFIRKILSDKFGPDAGKVRVIYGGSANEKDAADFLQNGGVDGLLPGKASLDPIKFSEIVKIAENI